MLTCASRLQKPARALQLWKMQPRLNARKIGRFPRGAYRAIRAVLLVREMHSPLNVSRQPLRKRDKSRRAIPSAIFSRWVSRRRGCRCRHRRRCSGIKYPIESLIRLQTRPILGHLFAPTAMFALGVRTRSANRYFSVVRFCNIHRNLPVSPADVSKRNWLWVTTQILQRPNYCLVYPWKLCC